MYLIGVPWPPSSIALNGCLKHIISRFSTMGGKFSPWTARILSTLIALSLRERSLLTVVGLSPLQSPSSSCIDDNDTGSIHFLQTGSRQGADAILRPGFEIEDLAGRCLMPGFIGDSRSSFWEHLNATKLNLSWVSCSNHHRSTSQTRTSTRPWRPWSWACTSSPPLTGACQVDTQNLRETRKLWS